jgi:hypothetical protein
MNLGADQHSKKDSRVKYSASGRVGDRFPRRTVHNRAAYERALDLSPWGG